MTANTTTAALDELPIDAIAANDWMDVFYSADGLLTAEEGVDYNGSAADDVQNYSGHCYKETPPHGQVDNLTVYNGHPAKEMKAVTHDATIAVPPTNQITDAVSAEAKAQARSERKRTREKQRRLDVNSQIVDLTAILQKVDADDLKDVANTAAAKNSSPGNRVDLIGRTIAVLNKIHGENRKRQAEISDLQEKVSKSNKNLETMIKEREQAVQSVVAAPNNAAPGMVLPMINGGYMQMQPMIFPPTCFAPSPNMFNPFMPKMVPSATDTTKIQQHPSAYLQYHPSMAATAFAPQSSTPMFHTAPMAAPSPYTPPEGGNLAHCA